MVNSPFYNLAKVKQLAQGGKIGFSRTASRDARNLGYSDDFVHHIMAELEEKDFYKSHTYNYSVKDGKSNKQHCDAYRKTIVHDENIDDLYIKFSVMDNYLEIELLSFHLNR